MINWLGRPSFLRNRGESKWQASLDTMSHYFLNEPLRPVTCEATIHETKIYSIIRKTREKQVSKSTNDLIIYSYILAQKEYHFVFLPVEHDTSSCCNVYPKWHRHSLVWTLGIHTWSHPPLSDQHTPWGGELFEDDFNDLTCMGYIKLAYYMSTCTNSSYRICYHLMLFNSGIFFERHCVVWYKYVSCNDQSMHGDELVCFKVSHP